MLLFVTGDQGSAVIHVVDMGTSKERHFSAYDSNIGNCIRPSTEEGEKVESVVGDTVIVSATALGLGPSKSRYKYLIDLKEPKFIREERDFPGFDGKWHHCIFEEGKANWKDVGQSTGNQPAPQEHGK